MRIPMRQVFGETLMETGTKYDNLVVLDADVSSSTQTIHFAKEFPDRFYNFGIAEQDMAAAAAGFAANGDIPVVSTFAFLLALRSGDAVRSLIAYNRLNVKLAGGYAGLSDFADGASHQSVTDLAIMRALPNMTVLSPSDIENTRGAVKAMLDYEGAVYLRLSRAEIGSLHNGNENFFIGKAQILREGSDITLITHGPILEAVLSAANALKTDGISCHILECATVKPLDKEAILKAAQKTGQVITIEEASIIGGLGSAVAEILCEESSTVKFRRLGLMDTFGESGSYNDLLEKYGLNEISIVQAIKDMTAD